MRAVQADNGNRATGTASQLWIMSDPLEDELLDDDRRFEDSESERDAERERAKGDIKLDIQDADL